MNEYGSASVDDSLVRESHERLVRERVNADETAFTMRGALGDLINAIDDSMANLGADVRGRLAAAVAKGKAVLGRME